MEIVGKWEFKKSLMVGTTANVLILTFDSSQSTCVFASGLMLEVHWQRLIGEPIMVLITLIKQMV